MITDDEFRRVVPERSFAARVRYHLDGRVQELCMAADGTILLAMHAKLRAAVARRGVAGSGIVILDALLKLRQACCDPRLLKLSAAKSAKAKSAKLERLFELLLPLL